MDADDLDPLIWEAAELVIKNDLGSTSMLQRKLKIGFGRGSEIARQLTWLGVIGPTIGTKAGPVLIGLDQLEELRTNPVEKKFHP